MVFSFWPKANIRKVYWGTALELNMAHQSVCPMKEACDLQQRSNMDGATAVMFSDWARTLLCMYVRTIPWTNKRFVVYRLTLESWSDATAWLSDDITGRCVCVVYYGMMMPCVYYTSLCVSHSCIINSFLLYISVIVFDGQIHCRHQRQHLPNRPRAKPPQTQKVK